MPRDHVALQMPLIVPKVEMQVDEADEEGDEEEVKIGMQRYDGQQEEEEEDGDDEDDNFEDDDEVFDVAGTCIEVESILKERPRTPKLFDAVMEAVRPDSKVKGYFSRSQSIASTYVNSLDEAGVASGEEVKIKVEEE